MAKSWHFHTKNVIWSNCNVLWLIESNIRAPVLLNFLNSLLALHPIAFLQPN